MSPSKKLPPGVATSGTLALVSQLHAPARPGSRATVVEHQLRTGIGIGVLEAGDRLPSEQIMARHMGVSALTFRQALDRLREDNLVSTRPGRGGGTFINASLSALEQLAKEALAAISLAEIADIGQSAAELHGSAARLAAERRDETDIAELGGSSERLIEQFSAVGRRRASTLYVIMVARIARAETLLAALIPLIGRLQLMAWTDDANDTASELNRLSSLTVDAIRHGDPEAAALAARNHVQVVVEQIISDRSKMFATADSSDGATSRERFHVLQQHMHKVKDGLEVGRHRLAELDAPFYARGHPSESVDEILKEIAVNNSQLLRGAGIAYAPAMLKDARLWMDWWDSGYSHELTFKSHEFNTRSLQYYDYEHMPWFTEPLRTKEFSLVGPYLDRGGIETSTITASLPIATGPFEGCVLGADLHVPAIEQLLLHTCQPSAINHVLVNRNNRVLVSTSPTVLHGALLNSENLNQLNVVAQENDSIITGWRLLTQCQ